MSFRFWPTLMTAIMLAVLLALGTWQLQRLHWKQNLLATIDARFHAAPADAAVLADTPDASYRPATAAGIFNNDHIFYLFGTSLTGVGGYHVLTPLALADGRVLLVDRGWIPYDHKGNFSENTGLVTVAGILRKPEHYWLQPKNDPTHGEWYSINLAAMAQQAGVAAFLPYVLEADARPNPGGYPIGGQTRVILPNNHFVYALTWYGLALALVIIYLISSRQKNAAD